MQAYSMTHECIQCCDFALRETLCSHCNIKIEDAQVKSSMLSPINLTAKGPFKEE